MAEHYGRGGLLNRILTGLSEDGKDLTHLTEADLAPVDEFHNRGKHASNELFAEAGFDAGMKVLDVGCGIGGPSRRLARQGLNVTSIDLTPEFIEVAKDLTQRAGLADKIEFHTGSALDLPFDGGTFDGVWLQHVNMNIGDKERLFAEIGRVLKPGGRLACHEVVLGGCGDPILPAPWASYPECSFVAPWSELKKCIEAADMTVSYEKDDTAASIEFFDVMFDKMAGSAPHVGLPVLFGKDSLSYLQNAAQSLKEDRCRVMQAVATKRG